MESFSSFNFTRFYFYSLVRSNVSVCVCVCSRVCSDVRTKLTESRKKRLEIFQLSRDEEVKWRTWISSWFPTLPMLYAPVSWFTVGIWCLVPGVWCPTQIIIQIHVHRGRIQDSSKISYWKKWKSRVLNPGSTFDIRHAWKDASPIFSRTL